MRASAENTGCHAVIAIRPAFLPLNPKLSPSPSSRGERGNSLIVAIAVAAVHHVFILVAPNKS